MSALPFTDDFEEATVPDMTKWTGTVIHGGEAIPNFFSITAGAHGNQAIQCNVTTVGAYEAFLTKTFAPTYNCYARVYFKMLDLPVGGRCYGTPIDLRVNATSGYGLAWTSIDASGILSLYHADSGGTEKQTTTSFTLTPGNWYYIELHVGVASSPSTLDGVVELWACEMGGTPALVASVTGINNLSTIYGGGAITLGPVGLAQIGERYFQGTTVPHAVEIDDVKIDITGPIGIVEGGGNTWTLITSCSPSEGGLVSDGIQSNTLISTYVPAGQAQTIYETPNSPFTFTNWSGAATGTDTSITVPAQTTGSVVYLTAHFSSGNPPQNWVPMIVLVGGAAVLFYALGRSK